MTFKRIFIWIAISTLLATSSQAGWVYPKPVLTPLSPEEQKRAETDMKFRRTLAGRMAREFLEKYNEEFQRFNGVKTPPLTDDLIRRLVRYTETLPEEALRQADASVQYQQLKTEADKIAQFVASALPRSSLPETATSKSPPEGLGRRLADLSSEVQQRIQALESRLIRLEERLESLQVEKKSAGQAPGVPMDTPRIAPEPEVTKVQEPSSASFGAIPILMGLILLFAAGLYMKRGKK